MPANALFTDWVTGDLITATKLNLMKNSLVNNAGDTMTGALTATNLNTNTSGSSGLSTNGAGGAFASVGWDAANARARFVAWNGTSGAPYNFENGALQATSYRVATTDVIDASRNAFFVTLASRAGTSAGGMSHISLQTSSLPRFQMGLINTEGGANSGSNFTLWRYTDAGAFIGDVFTVARATGVLNFPGLPTIQANAIPRVLSTFSGTSAAFTANTGTNGLLSINIGQTKASGSSLALDTVVSGFPGDVIITGWSWVGTNFVAAWRNVSATNYASMTIDYSGAIIRWV